MAKPNQPNSAATGPAKPIYPDWLSKGGKSRWKDKTPAERSQIMRKVRKGEKFAGGEAK